MKQGQFSQDQRTIFYPIQVLFFDTDAGGVTHNLAYLRMVEEARTLLAVHLGLDWDWMKRHSTYPVLIKTEVEYHSPAFLGDELEVEIRLDEAKGVRFYCLFSIKKKKNQKILVSGRQTLAFVQLLPGENEEEKEGKPLRLPKGFPSPFLPILD